MKMMRKLKWIGMVIGVSCFNSSSFGQAETYIELDFEVFTVGEQPDFTLMPRDPDSEIGSLSEEFLSTILRFTPASNTTANGVVVIDRSSQSPLSNPLTSGKSLLIYDRSSDAPTHFRFPFYWPPGRPGEFANGSEVGVRFYFQRAYAVDQGDTETGIHLALGRVGDPLNNSDFRPFELRILNNGNLVLNSLEGTQTIGAYDVSTTNWVAIIANSHDADDHLTYNHRSLDPGFEDIDDAVPPNSLHVWLNLEKLGEYKFHVTPDPVNAPEIVFNQSEFDLGQLAFYQDTGRQGGIVIDDLWIGGSEEEDDDNGGGPGPTTKLVNISARAFVGTGDDVLIGGFIIRGDGEQEVLVQAVGPELANFGITNALADPVLTVTNTTDPDPSNHVELMVNDDWEDSQGQLVTELWGGNPNLAAGSASSAAVLTLGPGNYSGKVEGKNETTGVAAVEVYEIDR